MLNIFIGITGTLFIAAFILDIVFIRFNKPELIKILKHFPISLLYIFTLLILIECLPDSMNILVHITVSLILAEAGLILAGFPEKPQCLLASRLSYIISVFVWFLLYRSTFHVYPLKIYILLPVLFLYAVLLFIFWWKRLRSSPAIPVSITLISLFCTVLLQIVALCALCGDFSVHSALVFAGSAAICVSEVKKEKQLICNVFFIAGELLLCSGSFLMQLC